jgi:hypothetical protein
MVYTRHASRLSEKLRENASNSHYSTPEKARLRAAYRERKQYNFTGTNHSNNSLFRRLGIAKSSAYRILASESLNPSDRTFHNDPAVKETRGRPKLITDQDLSRMEAILESCDVQGRSMTWETLGYEAGLDVSVDTIRRAMGTLNYHKCIACQKGWVSDKLGQLRKEWAATMLERYPTLEHWKRVRFSDEVHFCLGPQGRLMIIRRPGERYCQNCIQSEPKQQDTDKKRIHAWGAIGYNFKSPLVFYNIPSNSNGKMTQQAYIDQILEPVVKPWIDAGHDFVLEEDGDSGHGPPRAKGNIVVDWKEKHGLKHYFNCPGSPDMAPIEDAWQPSKQYVRHYGHWEPDETRTLAQEGWDGITQEWINRRILSMPARLEALKNSERGELIGYGGWLQPGEKTRRREL